MTDNIVSTKDIWKWVGLGWCTTCCGLGWVGLGFKKLTHVHVCDRHEASRGLFATAELLVIVYSTLHRGIQSATEMLPSLEKGGDGVAHSCNF